MGLWPGGMDVKHGPFADSDFLGSWHWLRRRDGGSLCSRLRAGRVIKTEVVETGYLRYVGFGSSSGSNHTS